MRAAPDQDGSAAARVLPVCCLHLVTGIVGTICAGAHAPYGAVYSEYLYSSGAGRNKRLLRCLLERSWMCISQSPLMQGHTP